MRKFNHDQVLVCNSITIHRSVSQLYFYSPLYMYLDFFFDKHGTICNIQEWGLHESWNPNQSSYYFLTNSQIKFEHSVQEQETYLGNDIIFHFIQISCAQFSSNLLSSNFFRPILLGQGQVSLCQIRIGRKQEDENRLD